MEGVTFDEFADKVRSGYYEGKPEALLYDVKNSLMADAEANGYYGGIMAAFEAVKTLEEKNRPF